MNSVVKPNVAVRECGKDYYVCFTGEVDEKLFTEYMANKISILGFAFEIKQASFQKISFPKLRYFESLAGLISVYRH